MKRIPLQNVTSMSIVKRASEQLRMAQFVRVFGPKRKAIVSIW